MIRVKPRPEPAAPIFDFDQEVRRPGDAWLAANPGSAASAFPPHWRKALPQLRRAYKGICAYFCCYVRPATGGGSADHFVAKSSAPHLAYAWDNYRFACARMNSRKQDASDVLDPFTLADGQFALSFTTMRVTPASGLSGQPLQEVRDTIARLDLNSEECRKEREEHWDNYNVYHLDVSRFVAFAPFIAMEAARQGLLKPADHAVTVASIRAWLDA